MKRNDPQATPADKTTSVTDRRRFKRSPSQNRATTLIQMVLTDARVAAEELERDLRAGGDPEMVGAVLWAAEAMARLRGLELGPQVRDIAKALAEKGYPVG